jgi:UPF0755 protein
VDNGSARITARPGSPAEPPKRRRRSHVLPLLVGVAVGAAAIAVAVVLLRGNGGEAAPAPGTTADPPPPVLKIIFPEGFTREQMAGRIAAVNEIAETERGITTMLSPEEYLAETKRSELPQELGAKKPASLEGFLFPATYEFTPVTSSQMLVDDQLAAFHDAWAKVDLSKAEKRGLTPYEVLIIASMIEEEVRVPRERRLVAGVVYNRLEADMPLGIDATLRYGLDIPPDESISQSDLESNNPYNTRKHKGLPPTPITNPGLAAMRAAANPADVDYLYYARKKDCKSHFFTASFEKFEAFLAGPRC